MDIEGLEVTAVINGMRIEGLRFHAAAGLLADARDGVDACAFATADGRAYLFAGPLSVAVSFSIDPDMAAAAVQAGFEYLERLARQRAGVEDDIA